MSHIDRAPVSAVILAGGQARRLGGVDKGLIPLRGRPLAAWVSSRIQPQVREVLVSANRNMADYAALGHTVAPDYLPGRQGPLAGLLAASRTAQEDWLLTLPCDVPFIPLDLAVRMHRLASAQGLEMVRAEDETGVHYAVMLLHRRLLSDIEAYMEAGGRAVRAWQERHAPRNLLVGEDPYAFLNINTLEDLRDAERLASRYE